MSFEADEEILQDFLIEAGELLETLNGQLVELEQRGDDRDLLNAIFRAFHTVKGGAGFLQIEPLVECCHIAENVFDALRNGQISVTPEVMDVVLQAYDAVISMFDQVRDRQQPKPADPGLLARLNGLISGEAAPEPSVAAPPPPPAPEPPAAAGGADDEITDEEFEALLDQLHGSGKGPGVADAIPESPPAPAAAGGADDEITDDEFEALLDQLHGKGQFKAPQAEAPQPAPPAAAQPAAPAGGGDEITDDEFEALLDQLHGKGQFKGTAAAGGGQAPPPPASPAARSAPGPERRPEPPAAPEKPAEKPPEKVAVKALEPEATVRVDTRRLDSIMNMVGELVLVRNRLVRLGYDSGNEDIAKAVANLDVVTADLQMSVMKTRMQPIKKVFGRFPRVVRDLARTLNKEINLEMVGEETDLDKNLVEALADPLVHLVRNSVDHGIEMPAVRQAAGKPRAGRVVLAAQQEGDHILLSITDDGGGMDPDLLREKAVAKGVIDRDVASRMTPRECFNLIFAPGFSTRDQISDVSGRGVGMDVVKTKITQLNGTLEIDSEKGKGTVISIKVPLTLAIMPTLMVILGKQTFALPLVNVNEIFNLDLTRTNVVDGQEVIVIRNKPIPLFYLSRWLVRGGGLTEPQPETNVVIVAVGEKKVGFVVDHLIGQEEVVIKPLGALLHGTPGMAGATITGDGRIALILDVPAMLKHYARRF